MTAAEIAPGSLAHTPTWAVATVCFIIVSISVFLEHSINLLMDRLKKRRKTVLYDAIGRVKSGFMLLGFLSFLLAATQGSIPKICISAELANTMLPCGSTGGVTAHYERTRNNMYDGAFERFTSTSGNNEGGAAGGGEASHGEEEEEEEDPCRSKVYIVNTGELLGFLGIRDGLGVDGQRHWNLTDENFLVVDGLFNVDDGNLLVLLGIVVLGITSGRHGMVSLITSEGVEQLEQFLFVLAATQTLYSVLTVALGRIKMRRWETWEKETQSTDHQNSNDKNNRRFSRQTTFWKRHETCTETPLQLWIKCFFRQFFSSVAKTDYLTLRHGFITTHLSSGQLNSFNFQKYITHSLDEDFRTVISISPFMWLIVVIFMLVDIHGWHSYFWISFLPLTIVLIVGTKLEVIVAKMALDLKKKKNVITGAPQQVKLSDDNFWFGQPSLLLDLLHLTLFLNAFEVAFFVWVMMEFGSDSCYHERTMTIIRLVLALVVQVMCSYITLPHYALVTQMGSQFKGGIFNEKVAQVLKQWHTQVRRNRRKKQECDSSSHTHTTADLMEGNHVNNSLDQSPAPEEGSRKSDTLNEITEEEY